MKSIVLGSRSPRRCELLQHLVPPKRIRVVPPFDSAEAGFEGLTTWEEYERRLFDIVQFKCDDVCRQLADRKDPDELPRNVAAVVCADTVIVAENSRGELIPLEQPPDDETWPTVVRRWFTEYLSGRTHTALSGICIGTHGATWREAVRTRVTFHTVTSADLDWYVGTEEPRGKAGGYALQGAGSVFVSHVEGSLSNVVGLPLEALRHAFTKLKVDVD